MVSRLMVFIMIKTPFYSDDASKCAWREIKIED
jgi:hypothetical protein